MPKTGNVSSGPQIWSSHCLRTVPEAVGGARNVPLGEHVGWEERSETRIPESVNMKGVSGKGRCEGDGQPLQGHGGT